MTKVQGAESDQYKAVLHNRRQLLASPSEQTLQRYFPENYECDVIEVVRVLQGLDRSTLGEKIVAGACAAV